VAVYDLILFGRMATDTANGTVGPMTAELLGLPCVTSISHLEIAERTRHRSARPRRRGGRRCSSSSCRADDRRSIARPRLASLKGIMAAKKKPLEVKAGPTGRAASSGRIDGPSA